MKYFTYDLIAAENDWVEQTGAERTVAKKRFLANIKKYQRGLERLRPVISQAAWNFFRNGFGEEGLHDGRLLSLTVGDGLKYQPNGTTPFRRNYQHTTAVVEFLNFEQSWHYEFQLRGVRRIKADLFVAVEDFAKSLGDLYIYELTSTNKGNLQLGFLFATGASVVIEFKTLVFKKRRVNRQYPVGEIFA